MTPTEQVLMDAYKKLHNKTVVLVNKTADLLEDLSVAGVELESIAALYQYILLDTNLCEMLETRNEHTRPS